MIKIVTVERMRQIEAAADASGLSYAGMMENAGRATATRAMTLMAGREDVRVTVLVGKGNNGGDGLVAARILAQESAMLVRCYLLEKRDGDPLLEAAREAGATIASAEDDQGYRVLRQMTSSAHLLLDALFGIGIKLPLRDRAAKLLQNVNNAIREARTLSPENQIIHPAYPAPSEDKRQAPFVLAVDCPSGLDCDSGEIDPNAIPADETITFIAAKPGLLTFPGAASTGQITVATIGIPASLDELKTESTALADAAMVRSLLPDRGANSHKGTYGKTLIVGGSPNYRGAIGLSAKAAYRAGAGLVTASVLDSVAASLAGHILETTWLTYANHASARQIQISLQGYNALLLGPGWGRSQTSNDLFSRILNQHDQLPPLVIDADGLNMLAEIPDWWELLPENTIITPHPGEMSRLTGASTTDVQANRWPLVAEKAAQWQVILVLKGAHTLVASPDGRITALPFKTDALAKAGTGDVLAGILAGLLSQGMQPYDAAVVGGYVHGLAGIIAAETLGSTRSVLASDVIDALPQAFKRIENVLPVEA